MELWIRSQDKDGLYKVDEIYIDEKDYGDNVISYYIRENGVLLGIYKTKERALEVLDEIQDYLIRQGQLFITTNERGIPNGSKYYSNVYEMPKE